MSEFHVGDRVRSVTTNAHGTVRGVKVGNGPAFLDVQWDGDDPLKTVRIHEDRVELLREDSPPAGVMPVNPKDIIGATKPDLSLVPPAAIIGMAQAMKNGADKYGAYNWREHPVQVMTYLAAAQRHILQYLDGEEFAEDSGVHHLAHAAACVGIVMDAKATGNLVDNRPKAGAASKLIKEGTVQA